MCMRNFMAGRWTIAYSFYITLTKHTTYNLELDIPPSGKLTEKICAVLADNGPMTMREIRKAVKARYKIDVSRTTIYSMAHYAGSPRWIKVAPATYALNKVARDGEQEPS